MKLNIFERILLSIILVLLVLTGFFSVIRRNDTMDYVDNDIYSFTSIVRYALIQYPYQTIVGWVNDFDTYANIRLENDKLRQDLQTMNEYKSELMESRRQIKELQRLLDLKTTMVDYDLINATIISRDYDTWSNLIQIDVGTNDGIDENYAVITADGLIGRIYRTYANSSLVKLLTAEDGMNKVSVLIQVNASTTVAGYLENYDPEKGSFVIKLLSTGQSVTSGMSVMTSGMGGVFPAGLFIGTIQEISEVSNAVGMNVYVKPVADFNTMNYVSVVKMRTNND